MLLCYYCQRIFKKFRKKHSSHFFLSSLLFLQKNINEPSWSTKESVQKFQIIGADRQRKKKNTIKNEAKVT